MAANVETMFYTRTKPWHGLGTMVEEAANIGGSVRTGWSGEWFRKIW